MKEFNPNEHRTETMSAMDTVIEASAISRSPAYIGLDVHKESIIGKRQSSSTLAPISG